MDEIDVEAAARPTESESPDPTPYPDALRLRVVQWVWQLLRRAQVPMSVTALVTVMESCDSDVGLGFSVPTTAQLADTITWHVRRVREGKEWICPLVIKSSSKRMENGSYLALVSVWD